MTAALGSGSAPRPLLPQPWARALPLLLCSGPSPFKATRQPSSGRPKAEDLRPKPLTGTTPPCTRAPTRSRASPSASSRACPCRWALASSSCSSACPGSRYPRARRSSFSGATDSTRGGRGGRSAVGTLVCRAREERCMDYRTSYFTHDANPHKNMTRICSRSTQTFFFLDRAFFQASWR
jgi:hypothetical protein